VSTRIKIGIYIRCLPEVLEGGRFIDTVDVDAPADMGVLRGVFRPSVPEDDAETTETTVDRFSLE
jgi:hypothetical protein